MARQPDTGTPASRRMQIAMIGIVVALVALLVAVVARSPLHPPFYDTISSASDTQGEAP